MMIGRIIGLLLVRLPEELAECILYYILDLAPVGDISFQAGIHVRIPQLP